jgi:23S rRNA pseudouridine2457 synthase
VGRLDEDSEGLLLVSDQPWVIQALTTPGRVEKVYWAQVERIPSSLAVQAWREGVRLKDGLTAPARAELLADPGLPERVPPIRHRVRVPTAWLELGLKEGKNRQVRRMTAALGHPTLRLLRVAVGELLLGGLQAGESRPARGAELHWLKGLR